MKIDQDILFTKGEIGILFANPREFSHRTIVIQRVCELEEELCNKLADFFASRNRMTPKEKISDDLCNEDGLLGSLHRVAKVAFYLGFVSHEQYHDLKSWESSGIVMLTARKDLSLTMNLISLNC